MKTRSRKSELASAVAPKVTCNACKALPESSLPPPREKLIDDPNVIRKWRNVIGKTDVVHEIDAGGLIARYRIKDHVTCSFPDQRLHGEGWLGHPRCEVGKKDALVVRIGWCCAGKRISGFTAAIEKVARNEQINRWRSVVTTEPIACLRRLAEVRAAAAELNLFWPCSEELRVAFVRLARGPARDLEYTVTAKALVRTPGSHEMELKETAFVETVAGFEFWRHRRTSTDLEALECLCRRLRDLAQSRLSEADLERLYDEAVKAEKETTAFERWLGYGRQFFAPLNYEKARSLIYGVRSA